MPKLSRTLLWLLACGAAGGAQAQDEGLQVSAGVRAWYTTWTTFSYVDIGGGNQVLTEVSARDKLVLVPTISLRFGDWLFAGSAMPDTPFSFVNDDHGHRQELDVNLGYALYPGVVASLGYKRVTQLSGDKQHRYEPRGPVLGLSAQAATGGPLTLYGNLGLGQLHTAGDAEIKFAARYRLAEMGVAYVWAGSGWPRRWSLTAGYRIQLMSSYQALGNQDGQDTTQGPVFGLSATF